LGVEPAGRKPRFPGLFSILAARLLLIRASFIATSSNAAPRCSKWRWTRRGLVTILQPICWTTQEISAYVRPARHPTRPEPVRRLQQLRRPRVPLALLRQQHHRATRQNNLKEFESQVNAGYADKGLKTAGPMALI